MKKFYTVEPKNFRIFSKMKSFLAVALLLLMAVGTVNAQESLSANVAFSSFGFSNAQENCEGTVVDGHITFSTTNGDATTTTKYYTTGSAIRIYAHNGNGGGIVLSITNATVTKLVIDMVSGNEGSIIYCNVDNGSDLTAEKSGLSYTLSGIEATNTLAFRNGDNATSGHMRVRAINVTYTTLCAEPVTRTDNVTLCEVKNGNTNQFYSFYGQNLTATDAGTHTATAPGVSGACDTTVTLNLSVIPYYYEIEHEMAEGDTWDFNGTTVTDSSWVYKEFTASETACGCDSLVYAHVIFTPTVVSDTMYEEVAAICEGQSYTFAMFDGNDTICTETNIYMFTKEGAAQGGRDSVRVLYLDVNPTYNLTKEDAICQGTEYQFGEGVLGYHFDTDAEPGVYPGLVYTFETTNGCDSIVTLTLTINPNYNDTITATFCSGELPQNIGDIVIEAGKTSGVYDYHFQSVANCDSNVVVNLTINPSYVEDTTVTICASALPYEFRGHSWSDAGSETYNETTAAGCDSIVNFTLVVTPVYNDTVAETICPAELATYEFRGHTGYTEGGFYTYPGTTAAGCDSIVTLNLTVVPVFNREELDTTICINEAPFIYYGKSFSTTGIHVVDLTTCGDTTATLNLTVNETNACTFTVTIEAGENGNITGATTVNHGADYDYTITPNECYYIATLTLDGADQTITNKDGMTFTLDSVYTNHTIAATFEKYSYNVTATGTVEASDVFECGENAHYTFAAESGYHIDSLYIDGALETAATDETWTEGSHDFTMTADHSIEVFYSKSHYRVSASVTGIGGTVTPVGDTIYEFDAFPTYTFTMEDCIGVRRVLVDDNEVEVTGDSYTFDTLTHNTTLVVVFDTAIYNLTSVFHGPGFGKVNGQPEGVFGTAACASEVRDVYVDADATTHSKIDSVRWNGLIYNAVDAPEYQQHMELMPVTMNGSNNIIDVYFDRESNHVYANVVDGQGQVNPTDSVVYYTDAAVVTATADHGWHVATITCGNDTWTNQNGNADSIVEYTITSVTSDTNVNVTFAINTYTIAINVNGDGATTPAGPDTVVEYGSTLTLATMPTSCTYVDSLVVDGETVADVNLTNIEANHVVDVYFTLYEYTMTGAGANATVTEGTVLCGSSFTWTITADEFYHIDSVQVNGVSAETYTGEQAEVTHTETNVTENMVLTAFASLNHYNVTATATNGTVDPTSTSVEHGGSVVITMNPTDECYELTEVLVNGESAMADVVEVAANTTEVAAFDFSSVTEKGTQQCSSVSSPELNFNSNGLSGWTGTKVYGADGKLKIGSGSVKGSITTPALDLSTDEGIYTITFDAKAWNGNSEQTSIKVIVGDAEYTVTGLSREAGCEMQTFTVNGTGGQAGTTIRFEGVQASNNRFFLDNIHVVTGTPAGYVLTVNNITEATNVNATFSKIGYAMTGIVANDEGGTVAVSADSALCGTEQTYTLKANEGWHIASYIHNGTTTDMVGVVDSTVVTTTIAANDTLIADFDINTYTVTAQIEHQAGSVDHETQVVNHGESASIIFTADAANGYHIEKITCGADEVLLDSNTAVTYTYTVNEVVSDTTVKVYFKHNMFPITVIFDENDGEVVPQTTQNWEYGEDVDFQITPNACKYIDTILIDDAPITIDNVTGTTYTFNNVTAEHSIEVIFADSMFNMAGEAMTAYGTVSAEEVVCGTNYTYVIAANEGYHIHNVMIDGEDAPEYTSTEPDADTVRIEFTDIHADHLVRAWFELDLYDLNITANEGGNVTPNGVMNDVEYNTQIDFVFTPEACQELVSFKINDEEFIDSVENNAYTWFANTSGDIVATFDTIVYRMAETHTGEGTVTDGEVNCGEDYTYTLTAGEGYHIESYTLGGNTTTLGNNEDITTTVDVNAASSDTTLDVTFAINTYNVTACTVDGGTLTPATLTVNHGDNCDVTIAADAANGYHIDTITCGTDVLVFGANDSITYIYTITGITSDTSICAAFSLNNYKITASVTDEENIVIVPGDSNVKFGDTVVYTVSTLNDCHYISTVVIDGVDSMYNDSVAFVYAFNNIRDNHTIVANAEIYRYIANTSVNDENLGTITPTDTLDCGENFPYTVEPAHGYHIASVTVDSEEQTIADSSLFEGTIENIHANTAIVATFSINHYTLIAIAGENGTVSPADTTVVTFGDTVIYTIKPNDCYYISEVIVDGENAEITDSTTMTYAFENIDSNHTIEANFAIYTYAMTAEFDASMGNVNTADAQECGSEYKYIIDAAEGYHIVSYTINGVTTNNTEVEPNDFVTDTVVINPVSQDTNLVVVFDTNTYTVSVCTVAEGGELVVNDPTEVNHNEGTTVTVTADSANGYHIVAITDNRGGSIELGENTHTIYTYAVDNVTEDIEVCATFALNTFVITPTAGANGTITPDADTTVTYGEMIDFVIEPNHPCYYISNVVVDDSTVWVDYTDSVSAYTYTFNVSDFDPAEVNHTISAEFTIFEYAMTSNAYTEGTVNSGVVECGDDFDYEITANEGYHIDHVVLDGVTTNYEGQQASATISLTDIQSDHNLDVYFSINHYTVTATAGEHGTIEVAGVTTVAHGDALTYTITPDHCYYISELLVNDEAVEFTDGDSTAATYTFSSVEDTMTIHADFHIYEYAMTAEYDTTMGHVEEGIANCGSNFTYHVTANEGYHIVSMTVGTLEHNHYGLNEDVEATFNVYNVSQDTVCHVVFAPNTYTVNFVVEGEGTVDPTSATVTYDSTLAFTATAGEGYHVVSITDNGTEIYSNDDRDSVSYEGAIANIRENHTVTVVFGINQYTITATVGEHGEVFMGGTQIVNYGENINFTYRTSEDCYHIDSLIVDSTATVFTNNETYYVYNFTNVTADHTISATFAINTYTVTATVTGNGAIMNGENEVDVDTLDCGETVDYTFVPEEGLEVVSVAVNGHNMGVLSHYTVTNIRDNYTIEVVFDTIHYTLTASATGNGTIDPEGTTTVAYGATQTYTVTAADDCQELTELTVNGVSYMEDAAFDGTTLTLANIQADMNIQATFQTKVDTVETTATDGGTITETVTANCGTDVVITITPDACYEIDYVEVDGQDQGVMTEVTFNAIDANHAVNAYFKQLTYVVTASVNDEEAGTITATDTFNCGENVVYEITPNEGYHIESVEVDGEDQGAVESYTFTAINDDHTIVANFAINTYTIHGSVYGNIGATITTPAAGDTIVNYNETVTYSIEVDSCYDIADVLVDGESVGTDASYTFNNVTEDHEIMVLTTIKTYTISVTSNIAEGGTLTPAGDVTVDCGGTQSFSFTPAAGYTLDSVMVDGESAGQVYNYVFSGVTEDHTIEVFFSSNDSNTYTITATAGDNGTITPEGDTTVYEGTSITYVFTPDEYYTIGQVIVDSVVLPTPVTSYTFANIHANHTIEVTFVADELGCVTPGIVYTTDVTTTSAKLNWNDTEASSYTVRYKKLSDTTFTIVTNITETFYEVSGLDCTTEYVWSVKSVCVDSIAESAWSVPVLFVTEEPIDTTVDIHNADMAVINVYSFGNEIYVTNESNEQIKDVQVYDMNGRMIHKGMAQSNPEIIQVNAANGIYIVRVVTNTTVRNYKVSITQR